MAIMDIQVSPRSAGTVSVSGAVVIAQQLIRNSGLKHLLHPMGTCIEGDAGRLYALAADIHDALVVAGYERIGVLLKVDDRRDKDSTMDSKLNSVLTKLEQTGQSR
jgi:uncharacterized protein (TIGR00106 family)